jgi:hypothetical protein
MANDRDQEIIASAVSDAAANLVSLLPSLGAREVLAFGEGVALPARIAFAQLPEHLIPTSRVKTNNRPLAVHPGQREEEHVESVVARWRGASTFKQSSSRDAAPAHSLLKDNVQLQASDRPASDRLSILRKSIGNNTGVTPRRTV